MLLWMFIGLYIIIIIIMYVFVCRAFQHRGVVVSFTRLKCPYDVSVELGAFCLESEYAPLPPSTLFANGCLQGGGVKF